MSSFKLGIQTYSKGNIYDRFFICFSSPYHKIPSYSRRQFYWKWLDSLNSNPS